MHHDKSGADQKAQFNKDCRHSGQKDAFVKHLEHASEVVQGWPKWKQEILGGTPSHPSNKTSSGSMERPQG